MTAKEVLFQVREKLIEDLSPVQCDSKLYLNDQCENPRLFGKGFSDDKKRLWRYRIGDYRLLCHLMDDRLIILVVDVGH